MNIPLTIVVLYVILLFIISFYAQRRAKGGVTNYILAGRQAAQHTACYCIHRRTGYRRSIHHRGL